MLTTDSKQRKDTPVYSGVFKYFPLALAAVARVSKAGNDKHNPGEPLHWARDKGGVDADAAARHILELGTIDPEDGESHDVHLAWRALANAERTEEKRLKHAEAANTTVGAQIEISWSRPVGMAPELGTGYDTTKGAAMPPPALSADTEERIKEHGRVGGRLPTEPRNTLEPGWLIEGNKATPLPRHTQPAQTQHFTFWYLATPYSKYPHGHEAAATLSAMLAARLLEARIPVFSPIAHSHPISKHTAAHSTDHDFWMNVDAPFMELASGLIVVTADSWKQSRGMAEEIKRFTAAGKPVVYWDQYSRIPKAVRETAR